MANIRALLALALAASSAAAQLSAFNWTLTGNPAGSGAVTSSVLHVVGPDAFTCDQKVTWFQTTAPAAGHVDVVADYITLDDWPSYKLFDAPVAMHNGVPITQPSDEGWFDALYAFSFDVQAGDTFGFGVSSVDCISGPGIADFEQFVFTPLAIEDEGGQIDPRLARVSDGTKAAGRYGAAVAALGDLDGDGVGDEAVGEPDASGGRVRVLSGATGAVLYEWPGSGRFGAAVAGAGDENGDGVPDVAVGAPDRGLGGRVIVFSGANYQFLYGHDGPWAGGHFGASLCALGDVNGDGFADIAVGAPDAADSQPMDGRVRELAGPGGAVLQDLHGPPAGGHFGHALALIGDLDGDGVADLAVGLPHTGDPLIVSTQQEGEVRVHSSVTGALLVDVYGYDVEPDFFFPVGQRWGSMGWALAPAGDIDGDGSVDLAVGSPGTFSPGYYFNDTRRGAVTFHAGTDGHLLHAVFGVQVEGLFGAALAAGVDLDGDGTPEVAVGAPHETLGPGEGVVRVLRPGDGATLQLLRSTGADELGSALASVGDSNGDGLPDLLVGAPAAGTTHAGEARLFAGLQGLAAPRFEAFGFLLAGTPLDVHLSAAPPASQAVLVVGALPLLAPFKGGVLVPDPELLVAVATTPAGGFDAEFPWPAGIPHAASIWVQWWIPDPAGPQGFLASNGLRLQQP